MSCSFCVSELIKADIWRRKSWNTNKLGPNKCQFFSFANARHAGSTRLCHSREKKRRRKGKKKAGKLILHKGKGKMFSICHTQSTVCLYRADWGKGFSYSVLIYMISPHSPSLLWTRLHNSKNEQCFADVHLPFHFAQLDLPC